MCEEIRPEQYFASRPRPIFGRCAPSRAFLLRGNHHVGMAKSSNENDEMLPSRLEIDYYGGRLLLQI
jgi:hypothetical protein